MARRRSTAKSVQRESYKVQRTAGDIAAIERSPEAYLKRRVRRKVTRSIFRMLGL